MEEDHNAKTSNNDQEEVRHEDETTGTTQQLGEATQVDEADSSMEDQHYNDMESEAAETNTNTTGDTMERGSGPSKTQPPTKRRRTSQQQNREAENYSDLVDQTDLPHTMIDDVHNNEKTNYQPGQQDSGAQWCRGPCFHRETDRRASVAGAFPHGGPLRRERRERERERERERDEEFSVQGLV